MPEARSPSNRSDGAAAAADARQQALRRLGALAHQLQAMTRAADHFVAVGVPEDRDTGSWLMNGAVDQARDIAGELDGLARGLKDAPADAAMAQALQTLRVRAHQVHAAVRAADHFLDLDSREDRETAGWLIASARGLADRLAAEADDAAGAAKRPASEAAVVDAGEAAVARRVAQASAVRGVA